MNQIFKLTSYIFPLLLICSLLWGCHPSHGNPPVADFANHSCWDPAKRQRWETFRLTFEAQYVRVPVHVDGAFSEDMPSDDGLHPTQADLDHLEQRRTGNLHAASCRSAIIPGRVYDYSECSGEQLAAELFQEDEETHVSK